MRGGGDQYGITTKFTLETYPIGQIWGGIRVYNGKQRTQVFDALADFIQNNHKDPKAAMIYTSGGGQVICQFFYNGTTPPAGAFGKFEALKPSVDYIRTMSYPDLVS
jgi:hypothetical protein